jgi:hypothetical protein
MNQTPCQSPTHSLHEGPANLHTGPCRQLSRMKGVGDSQGGKVVPNLRASLGTKSGDLAPPGTRTHFQPQTRTFKPYFRAFKVTLWHPLSFLHETGFSGAVWICTHARHDAGIPTPPSTPPTVACGLRMAGGTKLMTHVLVTCTPSPQTRSKTVKLLLQHPVEAQLAHVIRPELRQP